MRNEIFQKIQENKQRFYNQVKSGRNPEIYETGDEPKKSSHNLSDVKKQTKRLLTWPGKFIPLIKGIKVHSAIRFGRLSVNERISEGFAVKRFMTGKKVLEKKFEVLKGRFYRNTSNVANQMLYFVLVFFGEESLLMEYSLQKAGNRVMPFIRLTTLRSVSFLIFNNIISGELGNSKKKKFETGNNLIQKISSRTILHQINFRKIIKYTGIKSLIKSCKVLYNNYISIFILSCNKQLQKIGSKEFFVRRL